MCVCFFSQGGQLVGLMPVLAACHLIYVFSVVANKVHVVANKVLSLSQGIPFAKSYENLFLNFLTNPTGGQTNRDKNYDLLIVRSLSAVSLSFGQQHDRQ